MTYEYEIISSNEVSYEIANPHIVNPFCPNGGIFAKCTNIFSCGGTTNGSCPVTNPGCTIHNGCTNPPTSPPPATHTCFLV